jgi:hypothetical protein
MCLKHWKWEVGVTKNEITIDTNVFEHLFHPPNNVGDHIDILLRYLVKERVVLCLDKKGRIFGEYSHRLAPILRRLDETEKLSLLRYFILFAQRRLEPVDFGDALMVAIEGVIRFAEPSDHVFVYVAIASDSILVSNNLRHITGHRNRLKRCATRHGSETTDFANSSDALAALGG